MSSELDETYWKIEQNAKSIMDKYNSARYFFIAELSDSGRKENHRIKMWCFHQCLDSMKSNGLIQDYDLSSGEVIL